MDCYNYENPPSLAEKIAGWWGQTFTLYLPELEVTGNLIASGRDYLILQLADNQKREVYIPFYKILMIVPGEALGNLETTVATAPTVL